MFSSSWVGSWTGIALVNTVTCDVLNLLGQQTRLKLKALNQQRSEPNYRVISIN